MYSPKYFKDILPASKSKKSSLLVRYVYRPISFPMAAIAANLGISANNVSYASAFIAILSCVLFFFPDRITHIIGAVLINIWLVADCVDGNLARGVKKQPYGEFADAVSSYLLVGFVNTAMGFAAYFEGGLFIKPGQPWIILLGALASSSDSLMRLTYQKFRNVERELVEANSNQNIIATKNGTGQLSKLQMKLNKEFGIGGILPAFILFASVFNALDIVVIYSFFYYGLSFLFSLALYIKKTIVNY